MSAAGEHQSSVTLLFDRLQTGDRLAANKLWDYFCPRLTNLARKTLGGRQLPLASEEDVAQSAFISFWVRAENRQFSGELHRNNLWRLLGTIAVRKALQQIRREKAQVRGGGNVWTETALAGADGDQFRLADALERVSTHDFDHTCERLLAKLDSDDLRSIALHKMMDYTNAEISDLLSCSERTVERKLNQIRFAWEQEIDG